jgi:hypothetical protein
MTYPGRVDIGSLLNRGGRCTNRTRVYPNSAKFIAQVGNGRPGGAHANIGNLMGFLDPFKAIPAFPTTSAGTKAVSLTHCEEFA